MTVDLSKEEQRLLDASVRRHAGWWCRNHRVVGWVGSLVLLAGIIGSVSFGLDTYYDVRLRSDESPPLVAWIPELLVPVGFGL